MAPFLNIIDAVSIRSTLQAARLNDAQELVAGIDGRLSLEEYMIVKLRAVGKASTPYAYYTILYHQLHYILKLRAYICMNLK